MHRRIIVRSGRSLQAPDPKGMDPWDNYNELFRDVPLWGGRQWHSLDTDQLVQVFEEALEFMCEEVEKSMEAARLKRELAIEQHRAKSFFWRFVSGLWVKFPAVGEYPTREQIRVGMIERCRQLADWMEGAQHRPFFTGSDMGDFIRKPRAVADKLAA